jgi:hypothetical protein
MNDIRYMYKQWLKNIVKHKQRAHYICVYLWITGITFARRRKSITIARKIYLRVVFFTFARIACYLEYI